MPASVYGALNKENAVIPTAIMTSAYTAASGDFVPVDVSGGPVTITLPAAPPDQTRIGVMLVKPGGTNTVTVNCSGSDKYNDDATTAYTLKVPNHGIIAQYAASPAVWYVQSVDLPLSQLDIRYAMLAGAAFTGPVSSADAVTAGVVTLTYSATLNINASLGGHFRVTLTGGAAVANPNSPTDGQKITLEVIQDGSGGRTLSWGTAFSFGSAGAPTLTTTPSKRDLLGFVYSASSSTWLFAGAALAL